eukprot:TRINITY_DN1625_c0_g1_i1.p2 TRINITY_DN1625_c0_g1~~TRINITY_DN1625_c0_g1_i1.p2  ORF type:complete len:129 (+),score=19.06 TRINITY_DN1625_c0_g1_i1:292-678(+)
MEFTLLQHLNCHLIVFHPYRTLPSLLADCGVADKELPVLAWSLVNDSYATDALLLHPPHEVAIAAVFMAGQLRSHDLRPWLASLRIDLAQIWAIMESLLEMYEVWVATLPVADIIGRLAPKGYTRGSL